MGGGFCYPQLADEEAESWIPLLVTWPNMKCQNPKTLDNPRRERLTWEGRVFGTSTSTQGFQSGGGRMFAAPHYTAQTLSSKTALHADGVCPTQEHILMAQPPWIRGHPAYR